VTLRAVICWTQTSHVSGISATTIDEDNRCEKCEDNQQSEEEEPPWFDIRESKSPKSPEERDVKKNTVAPCNSGETGVSKLLFKENRNFFLGDQALV